MSQDDLNTLLSIPMETRVDAEKVLFALEKEPDGLCTTTWKLASSVLGSTHGDDTSYLFDLHIALWTLAENHGLLLDGSHHDGMDLGLPFVLDYCVWHRKNAVANGKFDRDPVSRDYRDEDDEVIAQAIGGILDRALPAHAVPAYLRFLRSDVPALDAQLFDVSCAFSFGDLFFELGFTLDTGRGSNRPFLGIESEPTVQGVDLTCEGRNPNGDRFESTWNPKTAHWSNPLPLG